MLRRKESGIKRVVLPTDGAFVEDVAAWRQYHQDYDLAHLALLEGEVATYFTLEPMTRRKKKLAYSIADDTYDQDDFVIRATLVAIENYELVAADGSAVMAENPKRASQGTLGEMVSEEYMDGLNLPRSDHQILAMIARDISEARPPSATPSGKPAGDSSPQKPKTE